MEIWPAILFGFLASAHCIGMCGPIALALPIHDRSIGGRIRSTLTYNFGRIFTYAVLGAIFGSIGMTFAWAGWQQSLSIGLGILLLLAVLGPYIPGLKRPALSRFSSMLSPVRAQLAKQFKKRSYSALFISGLLNGLLPCGLVYLAIAGAIATLHWWSGAAFMALFGLGTWPAMIAISLAGGMVPLSLRTRFRKVVPIMVGLMAILLIMRGLNLGIPYVSPELTHSTVHSCH